MIVELDEEVHKRCIQKDTSNVDVVIIGSGPSACSAAIYAERKGLNMLMVVNDNIGGTLTTTDVLENYLGFNDKTKNISEIFKQQLDSMNINENSNITKLKIQKINRMDQGFSLDFEDGSVINTKSIIFATGSTRKSLPELQAFERKGVSYCAICDGLLYANKNVIVLGGGNTAVREALELSTIVKNVYIVCRSELRCDSIEYEKLLKQENIKIFTNTNIDKISKNFLGNITNVTLKNDKQITLPYDITGIFVAIGSKPNYDLVKDIVEVNENGILVDGNYKTSVDGIYACGDIISFKDGSNKHKQAIIAAGEGASAMLSCIEYLNKGV